MQHLGLGYVDRSEHHFLTTPTKVILGRGCHSLIWVQERVSIEGAVALGTGPYLT